MKCGIIGLPNTGKSTFFNILSRSNVLSENFPFCTIEPNYGTIKVPDKRLKILQEIVNPMKIIPSEIKVIDIAGLIKGAHKGDGLGNRFLSHIRETDGIVHMIRFFNDENISHVEGTIDPIRDKEIVDLEMQLKDLETIEKILKKEKGKYKNLLKDLYCFLKQGKNIRMFPFHSHYERKYIKHTFHFLTEKPVIYIANINKNINSSSLKRFEESLQNDKSNVFIFPMKNPSFDKIENVIKQLMNLLTLQNFFTVGKQEIRSWNIPIPCTAYEASSVIHTDFQKGFIKAEIIHYHDYIKYKSEEKIKKLGKIFLAGKKSLIRDGDIIHFRFNR
ncbi:redox-regulated ATPase YchF [Blattabacterium cuenoti]|uniref:redox-regulated ATPase YchF n=1 Tax=Blattabacterium cuenoti TaxID=1653831 RepID=UPI00163CF6E8|nr:redox-regulated ATPase YchF [Blattabacterium cuenoti]